MSIVWHRLQQGLQALFAFSYEIDTDLIKTYLSSKQYDLFRQMSHNEQYHCMRVLQLILEQEPTTPLHLAQAALLHDVGKSRHSLAVWQKTLAVLVKYFFPQRYRGWNKAQNPNRLEIAAVVAERHPAWGAELLQAIKADQAVIWLVRHHQDNADNFRSHPLFPLLVRLQAGDSAN